MVAYYNENEPFAAAWLRELIKAGLIADGEVDERSIEEVKPDDLRGFTQCHFFAGIGVWSYALRGAGWPDATPVWTGSCPCQSFSASGKRGGFSDKRHLWPAWFRLIRECRPNVCFGEQVASKDGLAWLDVVSADLEGEGYAIGSADLCAAGVGAPHIRQRLYFVADSQRQQLRTAGRGGAKPSPPRMQGSDRERERLRDDIREHGASGKLAGAECDRADGIGERGTRRNLTDDSEAGIVAHTKRAGRRGRWAGEASNEPRTIERPERLCTPGELGNAAIRRNGALNGEPQPRGGEQLTAGRSGFLNGFWRDAEWLHCRPEPKYPDGRWRPVEPGTFPLATGAPARMGRLRGYGNALNAETAKAFIEAWLELQG